MTDMSREPEISSEIGAADGVPVLDPPPSRRAARPSRLANDLRLPQWLIVFAIILMAGNLRAAVNVIGAVLPEMRESLGLTGAEAGLLTALPPFFFGFMGAAGPAVARKLGPSRTVVLVLLAMTIGQLVRAFVPGKPALFIGSAFTMICIAISNVLMPSLVRYYFPGKVAGMTAVYTVVLAGVSTLATVGTLPFENAVGGDWRIGLGVWAALSAVSLVPWLVIGAKDHSSTFNDGGGHLKLVEIARSSKAWILVLFFGVQSLQAYVIFGWLPTILNDEGYDRVTAAAYVGMVSLVSMVASIFVPNLMHRLRNPGLIVWALSACYAGGYVGLYFSPLQLTWIWISLIGVGSSFFPFALYVVTMRARTHGGVLALSGFMQGIGYLIAATGLILLGVVHGDSKNWDTAILGLIVLTVIQLICGLVCASKWTIEDELKARARKADLTR